MTALPRILARFTFLRCLALLGLMLGVATPALAAKTYSDNGDGTVTDPTTGLIWMRCSIGQTWSGTTCSGTASIYTWDQAVALTNTVPFAGHSDWRLPNIRELETIVDRSVYNPAIDVTAFPNTPASLFWSASAFVGSSSNVLVVDFYGGYDDSYYKSHYYQVRLVRAGQSFGLLDIARPSTDYLDQGNGTVLHMPTGLIWQRCSVGQTWTGSTCSGTASTFTWAAAKLLTSTFAGQSDWRLPTEEELISLVDYSRYNPAVNAALFPNIPDQFIWSASADASHSSYAWVVSLYGGWAGGDGGSTYGDGNQVLLVRAGQPAVPSAPGTYDGIYQWADGYYLSVHQIGGGTLIGTIYWVYTGNSVPIGSRTISEVDTFDLFHGTLVGSRATMTGTRFYRGCSPSYDFNFNSDSLTVRLSSVSNSPGVSVADVNCAARYNSVGSSWTIPKIY